MQQKKGKNKQEEDDSLQSYFIHYKNVLYIKHCALWDLIFLVHKLFAQLGCLIVRYAFRENICQNIQHWQKNLPFYKQGSTHFSKSTDH